jgi:tRNA modification GTPase
MTGEDTVEIFCHGGHTAPRMVLKTVLEAGARPAEPGEFTRRAFLNGKMDLTQAEGVAEIVQATGEVALRAAVRQLRGGLSDRLRAIEENLLEWLAAIEASIDFVEDEVGEVDRRGLAAALEASRTHLEELIGTLDSGRRIRHGVDMAIVGRPNVGKSTIFNRLIGEDRVIVSPEPGTTRDVVSAALGANGISVRLHDTAGLRRGQGPVEREAVKRTKVAVEEADAVLVVLDMSRPLTPEDIEICNEGRGKPHLVVANKADLKPELPPEHLEEALRVSALEGTGLDELAGRVRDLALEGVGNLDEEILVNERHAGEIRDALTAIGRAGESLKEAIPVDFVALDIRAALGSLGRVTGRRVDEAVLDEIFSRFCIGK